ncbi:Peptidase M1, alanine aminopeptidase/leukotriene A4 hydrolase [Sergentomyia squamirostris]
MLVKIPLCVLFLFFSVIIVATIHTEWQDVLKSESSTTNPVCYRLSNFTEPTHYELWIETHIGEEILEYSGTVAISLRVLEPTHYITIHSTLRSDFYSLVDRNNRRINVTTAWSAVTEIVTFTTIEEIVPSMNYTLNISFLGKLNDQSRGFFYRRYQDDPGRQSFIATTYLHSGNARFAFPCFDEPRYRTPFLIHITHDAAFEAISNMPVVSIVNRTDGYVTTNFEVTPPTSVNLISMTVTEYASKTELGPRDIPITIYAPKSFIQEVDFALNFSLPAMVHVEQYVDFEYPLPKLDFISILDFIPGAMENWGTFVFDSMYMLYKEGSTTQSQMMLMARIITHELIHNYFGSLVGVKWWTDMWMMEAFANFGEFYITEYFLPGYRMRELYVTEVLHKSLVQHGFIEARSVSTYVEEPRQVRRILEEYLSKAGVTVRMFYYILGEDVFEKCVQAFVREMAYKNAEYKDLYNIFEQVVEPYDLLPEDLKLSKVMESWFEQSGYPLLIVERNYKTNEIILNQQRFLSSRNESDQSNSSWYIPLSMSTSREPNMDDTTPWTWMRAGQKNVILKPDQQYSWEEDDWILFNIYQTGYFRINYDTQNWRLLAKELHQGYPFRIPPLNRAQLIDDSFNLAYADIIDFPIALDIIKYVTKEDNHNIWQAANRHLLSLNRRLDGLSYEKYFGRFLQHITDEHFDKLDVFENINPNESIAETFLRPIIVDLACRAGSGKCLTATRVLVMAESMTGHRLVPREVSSVYYCHGLKNANLETFEYFRNKLHSLYHEQERSHFSNSLTCFHDRDTVLNVLESTIVLEGQEFVYSNLERHALLATAFRNGHIRVVIDFFQEHHQDIAMVYGFSLTLDALFREMTAHLHLDEDIEAFLTLLETLEGYGHISDIQRKRIIDETEHNFEWVKDNKIEIEMWIQNYFEPGTVNAVGEIIFSIPLLIFATILTNVQ